MNGDIEIAVALVAVAALHFVSRSYLIARFTWTGSDSFYHFGLAELIRSRGITDLIDDRFIHPERVDYPILVASIAALLQSKWHQRLQFAGPVMDLATMTAAAAFAGSWFGPPAALLGAIVYASTPQSFDISYSFGPRSVANLFLAMALAGLVAIGADQVVLVLLVAVPAALVLLTHRLSAQSLMICLILYGLVIDVRTAATMAFLSVVVAIALSRGYYIKVLAGHGRFIAAMRDARSWLSWTAAWQHVKDAALRILLLVSGNPHLLVLPIVALSGDSDGGRSLLLFWIASLAALSLTWPFGEGERHFANAAFLVAVFLSSTPLDGSGGLLLLSVSVGTVLILIKLLRYPRLAARGVGTVVLVSVRDACRVIRNRPHRTPRPTVLAWPLSLSYQVMYFADAHVLLHSGGTGSGLVYNSKLRRRLAARGIAALTQDEMPDLVLQLRSVPLAYGNSVWEEKYGDQEVVVYSRKPPGDVHGARGAARQLSRTGRPDRVSA